MRALALAAMLLFAAPCQAETWLTASVTSYHQERGRYNEVNPGLGLELGSETFRYIGGFYRNSLYRTTVYAGFAYVPLQLGPFRAGGMFAIASGYSDHLAPVPVPVVAYEGTKFGLNVLILPPLDDKKGVLGFQVKAKF